MNEQAEGERPAFDVTRRGYRTSQVDAWVERATERLGRLDDLASVEQDLAEARQLARSLQAALDDARSRAGSDTFGARAEKVLRLAEHDARRRREQAEHEAEEIRDLVHFEAERTVSEARAEAGRLRAAAARDAERARAAAVQDADRVRAQADEHAAAVRAEVDRELAALRAEAEQTARAARAEVSAARRDADRCADTAASMHEHVRSLRSAVRDELTRLHTVLGAELRSLDGPAPRPLGTSTDPDGDTEAVVRVVTLPEQRDQPSGEQVTRTSGAPATATGD